MRSVACLCLVTFLLAGCVLPRPAHRVALGINGAAALSGVFLGVITPPSSSNEDSGPRPSDYGSLLFAAGAIGAMATLALMVAFPGSPDEPRPAPAT